MWAVLSHSAALPLCPGAVPEMQAVGESRCKGRCNQMQGHGEKFARKREQAVAVLLSEPTIVKAAKRIGVDEATLYRWLREEDFKEQYRQAKQQVVEHAITQLQNACTEAVATLRQVMADREAPASARVAAARTVLEQAIKAVELEDIEKRIEALEAIMSKRSGCHEAAG